MFVLSETEYAYTRFFSTVKECAHKFFQLDLIVHFGSLDHAEAIASAFENVWPEITLLSCWPHLTRAVKKHSQKLGISSEFYKDTIKEVLNLMHNARSEKQFDVLSEAVLADWRDNGAEAFADYFEKTYLTSRWRRWFITAASTPGVVPRQQAIEAHNKAIKAAIFDILRSNTARVLDEAFTRILLADEKARASGEPIRHYCVGPTPTPMVKKADILRQVDDNHYIFYTRGRRQGDIDCFIFNSRETLVFPVEENQTDASGVREPVSTEPVTRAHEEPSQAGDGRPDPVTRDRAQVYVSSAFNLRTRSVGGFVSLVIEVA